MFGFFLESGHVLKMLIFSEADFGHRTAQTAVSPKMQQKEKRPTRVLGIKIGTVRHCIDNLGESKTSRTRWVCCF
jgi:hypothetical protein